ncbi:MAG: helix-turn-helix transcriptional regulator [Saprospiraceae bacterium]|nr:helix-turn-helix transcriptional regulator [Lewinella sp.]
MDFHHLMLFFFSAVGAFNGLFLSAYFALFIKHKSRSTYFLSALLFAISTRVTKSVFLIFYPDTSNAFIQVGLTACALIGPLLYLYVKTTVQDGKIGKWEWAYHLVPISLIMALIWYLYPYQDNPFLWRRTQSGFFSWMLYSYWFVYLVLSAHLIRPLVWKLFTKRDKLIDRDVWLISLVSGVSIIWLGYTTTNYTSYIVGAFSFTFVFYLLVLLWIFKRRKATLFFDEPVKYANRKIETGEADVLAEKLKLHFEEKEIFRNPDLTLSDVAEALDVPSHLLSQYLNDNLGKSFSSFVNEYRIRAVEQELLKEDHQLTLEAIGNECGFRSNSSFYAAFKKIRGVTPAQFRKAQK